MVPKTMNLDVLQKNQPVDLKVNTPIIQKIIPGYAEIIQRLKAIEDQESTWDNKQDALTFDTTPSSGSTNPVTSDGIANTFATVNSSINSLRASKADIARRIFVGMDGEIGNPVQEVKEFLASPYPVYIQSYKTGIEYTHRIDLGELDNGYPGYFFYECYVANDLTPQMCLYAFCIKDNPDEIQVLIPDLAITLVDSESLPTKVSELENDIGYITNPRVVTISPIEGSNFIDCTLEPGIIYEFTGNFDTLNISLEPATDLPEYHFIFNCNSALMSLNLPAGVTMPDSWVLQPNRRYEINIFDHYGSVLSWGLNR